VNRSLRSTGLALLVAMMSSAGGAAAQPADAASSAAPETPAVNPEDAAMRAQLSIATKLLGEHQPQQALPQIEQVIATYEARFRAGADWKNGQVVYCARTPAESLTYLLEAAAQHRSAVVITAPWAEAYHLQSYALTDLKRFFDARVAIDRALALSPRNAVMLGESAQLYVVAHDWQRSLAGFRAAATAAEISPPETKSAELRRAWRGVGYVDVELRNLDEAEAMYRKCLELDPDDKLAARELDYVLKLRQRTAPN
jgi:tetratricopeptide (TPR) repeat protein